MFGDYVLPQVQPAAYYVRPKRAACINGYWL